MNSTWIDQIPMGPMPQRATAALQQPIPASARNAAPAEHELPPVAQAQSSAKSRHLRDAINEGPTKASSASFLTGVGGVPSLSRTLKNAGGGKVDPVRGGRKSLVDRVDNHEGWVYILGTNHQVLYYFERDPTDGEWRGYNGLDDELLIPEQWSPAKVLASMMTQGQEFEAYSLTGFHASGDDRRWRHDPDSRHLTPRGSMDSYDSYFSPRYGHRANPYGGRLNDPLTGLPRQNGLDSPPESRTQSRRASVHTIHSDEGDDAAQQRPVSPVSQTAPLVLTQPTSNREQVQP